MMEYHILDVFTDVVFKGNPLAVVVDADKLSSEQMLSIAKEFNLSETVFLRAPDRQSCAASVRIFTQKTELPFAGYPLIGAAFVIAQKMEGNKREVSFEFSTQIGLVPCKVNLTERRGFAEIIAPRPAAEAEGAPSVEAVAAALGLAPAEIGYGRHRPSRHEAGNPFFFVPVVGLDAIRRAQPQLDRWQGAFGAGPMAKAFLYCAETVMTASTYHARMFSPFGGVLEDPATGSAAAAFPNVLRTFDSLADGSYSHMIEQGFEVGRDSLIAVSFEVSQGKVGPARIGGGVVPFSVGKLALVSES